MKVRYGWIALLLVGITVLSLGMTALLGVQRTERKDGLSVVAGFYPMYTAALQVVGDVDGVSVTCLTQPTAGCLHDYQLSPSERTTLEQADLLILNGGGAESFLDTVLPQVSVTTVDTSAGETLLEASGHEHESAEEHAGHVHGLNEHCWMDPAIYDRQVRAICDALCTLDPDHAASYRQNTEVYCREIEAVAQELNAVAAQLPFDKAVLFHDTAAYTAEVLGLSVVGSLPIGEEQGFSAAEVKAVADAVRGESVLFLYDDQYDRQQEELLKYAAQGKAVSLNSAVSPIEDVADSEAWLYAMQYNIRMLKEAAV